jgi:hypothetical protein
MASELLLCSDLDRTLLPNGPQPESPQAVLVRNAIHEVREEAVRCVRERGFGEGLYLARGGLLGMNGNYAAGVLEGLVHHLPHTRAWLEAAR